MGFDVALDFGHHVANSTPCSTNDHETERFATSLVEICGFVIIKTQAQDLKNVTCMLGEALIRDSRKSKVYKLWISQKLQIQSHIQSLFQIQIQSLATK